MNNLLRHCFTIAIPLVFILGMIDNCLSQGFQRAYGNALDNVGWKVLPNGTSYYVLGSDEPGAGELERGTISYLNQDGNLLWTRRLNIASVIKDGVVTPGGDLIIVGSSLPANESSSGIIGSVDPSGSVNWLNTYDVPGAESFWRIVRSPAAENPLFPYIIAGTQVDSSQNDTEDDAVLLSINEFGTMGSKKVVLMPGDNELTRDLEILANGDMILTGQNGGSGTILWLNKAAEQVTAASPEVSSFWFSDLAVSGDGSFYAVGGANMKYYLSKLTDELLNVYDIEIENLTDISQVWEDASTEQIYVVGTGNFEGKNRPVIMNFMDEGDGVSLNWLKYLDKGETSFQGGSISFLPPDWIGYTDGRVQPNGGFGENCMFVSISDLAFTTCMTSESTVDVQNENWLYNGPAIEFFIPWDVPPATPLTSVLVAWQEQDVCISDSCTAAFEFQVNCGEVEFTDFSTIPFTPSWSWTFPGGIPSASSSQNPIVQFPGCGTYNVCLTVTGSGPNDECSATLCREVVIVDNIPPVALCLGIAVELDSDCEAIITPSLIDGGSFDNCQIQTMTVSPSVLTGCGEFPVTLTVTDLCGNTGTCTTTIQTAEGVAPLLTCPQDVTLNTHLGSPCSVIAVNLQLPDVIDNCGSAYLTYSIAGATNASGQGSPNGTSFNEGVSIITYTATDDCGNTSTCSISVTVRCNVFPGFKCGQAIVTFSSIAHSGQPGHVMGLVDLRTNAGTIGQNWNAPMIHHPEWTTSKMGQIFGIAIDNNYNVYVATSKAAYTSTAANFPQGIAGQAGIYKIDALTGNVSPFVTTENNIQTSCSALIGSNKLPNAQGTGPGLGNLCYDKSHNQFFVTNLEDGIIYRIDINGSISECYDPFNPTTFLPGVEYYDELIYGIGVNTLLNKIYFGRMRNDSYNSNDPEKNEVWSLDLDISGSIISGTEQYVLTAPDIPVYGSYEPFNDPIADIEFSQDEQSMLFGEQGKYLRQNLSGMFYLGSAGAGRVFEYKLLPSGLWDVNGKRHMFGEYPDQRNGSGGVDFGYNGVDLTGSVYGCDEMAWNAGSPFVAQPAYNVSFSGLAGVSVHNSPPPLFPNFLGYPYIYPGINNFYVDLDGVTTFADTDVYNIGDVDIFKCGCPVEQQVSTCTPSMASIIRSDDTDECRWSLNLNITNTNLSHLEIEVLTPGVMINELHLNTNQFILSTLRTDQNGKRKIEIIEPFGGGGLPVGTFSNMASFNLSSIDQQLSGAQEIEIKWFINTSDGPILFCSEIVTVDCQLPLAEEECWSASVLSKTCNADNTYTVQLQLTNNSDESFTDISFEQRKSPNPILSLISKIFRFPKALEPDSSYGPIEVIINPSQIILDQELFLLDMVLYSDSSYCSSDQSLSIQLDPCCELCESVSVAIDPVASNPDECQYIVDVNNACALNYITGIEIEIITPGVTFLEAEVSSPLDAPWELRSAGPKQKSWICSNFRMRLGEIDNLISFEINDVFTNDQAPQLIEIRWLANDENDEEFVACSETLTLNCQPVKSDSCIIDVDHSIECLPDGSHLVDFTFENNTNHLITDFSISDTELTQVELTPSIFSNVNLEPGEEWSGNFAILQGEPGPVTLDFQFSERSLPDEVNFTNTLWNCYEDVSLVLPECLPDSCYCGGFSNMYLRSVNAPPGIAVSCGEAPVHVSCPSSNLSLQFTGIFNCGNASVCSDSSLVEWKLIRLPNDMVASGSLIASPFFGLSILPSWYAVPGTYEIQLVGACGTDSCTCSVKYIVDCPSACICAPQDFEEDLNRGFSTTLFDDNCEACFASILMTDCDLIEWSIDGVSQGSSIGGMMFFHDFSANSTYAVTMSVTRFNADGTVCQTGSFTQDVIISCGITEDCKNSVITNPDFNLGAIAGGLNSGGVSQGWNSISGEPIVVEGEMGSTDAWSIQLDGNFDSSSILTTTDPVCLEKTTGNATLRFKITQGGVKGMLVLKLFRLDAFDEDDCNPETCYAIEDSKWTHELHLDQWMELTFPYDLRDWAASDECEVMPSVNVKPALYVLNHLSDDQGGLDTKTIIAVDNLCLGGMLVDLDDIHVQKSSHLFPNPTSGSFTLKLLTPAVSGMSIRITSLTGKTLLEKAAETGSEQQILDAENLPVGMYFVQLWNGDRLVEVEKLVKL